MSLVRLNIKSRIELERRVLAAALKQSFDRGDTDGASLAHKQLFQMLKDVGKAETGSIDSVRIADGVLPGVTEGEIVSEPLPSGQVSTAGQPERAVIAAVDFQVTAPAGRQVQEDFDPEPKREGPEPNDASLAAKLYNQPLFGQYSPTGDENGETGNESSENVSSFRQGFMRNSARLHALGQPQEKPEASLEPATPLSSQTDQEHANVAVSSDAEPLSLQAADSDNGPAAEPASDNVAPEQFMPQAADVVAKYITPEQIIQASTGAQSPNMVHLAHQLTAEMPICDLQLNPLEAPPRTPTGELPAPEVVLTQNVPARGKTDSDEPVASPANSREEVCGPGLYGLLGVSQMSAFDQIHTKFLRQARRILRQIKANRAVRYDKLPELQKLWIAHDILSDPVTRTDYDFRELGVRGSAEPIAHPAEEQQQRLGARTPLRIGELLQCAGLLETAELEIACDMHKAMPELQFGTFLVRQGFIEEHHLEAVLIGQKLLRAGSISVAQFQVAMDVCQAEQKPIGEALIDNGYISPAALDLALNPPVPDDSPGSTLQIREIAVVPKKMQEMKVHEIKTQEMKAAMPAWKDQLDWGPPEGEVSSSQPQPGQHADSPGSVTPAPAKQSLAGLLAGQQPSQISNKNAVPSWTDQIDWDTEDPSEPSGGAPVPSHEPSLKSGVSLGDFVSSAQAASEQEQGRSDESAILNFSNTNAVPTWKDQLDWGSPPEGETDDAADAPEPWLSQGFIDGLEESTAQVKPSTADGAVPEGQIDQTFSALEPESIVNPGAEPESEPWQSIETPSPVLSAPIAAQPAEPLPAFDQMAQAFEHLQAALAPPRDPAEAANADASVGEVQEKSPSFQGFPGIGQKTLENILAVPAIEGGFFAHLADKTDIFDGSSMPHSGAFGAIDSVSIDDPDPIEEREQHDPGESREEQDEQSTSESDTGKQTGEFEDGSEGADAEGVSRSKRRRTKEKRRKKK